MFGKLDWPSCHNFPCWASNRLSEGELLGRFAKPGEVLDIQQAETAAELKVGFPAVFAVPEADPTSRSLLVGDLKNSAMSQVFIFINNKVLPSKWSPRTKRQLLPYWYCLKLSRVSGLTTEAPQAPMPAKPQRHPLHCWQLWRAHHPQDRDLEWPKSVRQSQASLSERSEPQAACYENQQILHIIRKSLARKESM